MKILFFGDGRGRVNWGANATSTALHALLEEKHQVTSSIPNGDLGFKATYFPVPLLSGVARLAARARSRVGIIWSLFRKMGAVQDYLDQDIESSVDRFMKLKSRHSQLESIYQKILDCDAVVLNGEGSFIFKTPPRRESLAYMMVLTIAKRLGKKAYVLNCMISDCPVTGRNEKTAKEMIRIFRTCEGISVRDMVSYDLLKSMDSGLQVKFTPDALFSWFPNFKNGVHVKSNLKNTGLKEVFDFSKDYICVSGGSLARWTKDKAIEGYIPLINKLKELKLPILLIPTCRYDDFLEIVAEKTQLPILPLNIDIYTGATILTLAKVFVSGRFHPSILASQGGTPCVLMGSNSHKTLSLQEVLEYENPIEYSAIPNAKDIEDIYAHVKGVLEEGDILRNKILNTVERLSKEARTVVDLIE